MRTRPGHAPRPRRVSVLVTLCAMPLPWKTGTDTGTADVYLLASSLRMSTARGMLGFIRAASSVRKQLPRRRRSRRLLAHRPAAPQDVLDPVGLARSGGAGRVRAGPAPPRDRRPVPTDGDRPVRIVDHGTRRVAERAEPGTRLVGRGQGPPRDGRQHRGVNTPETRLLPVERDFTLDVDGRTVPGPRGCPLARSRRCRWCSSVTAAHSAARGAGGRRRR